MATSLASSGIRSAAAALRGRAKNGAHPILPNKRRFSASAHHDDAYETAKWEKITYAGIVTCTVLSVYNLSKGHPHHPDPPAFSYLHIRNKEFPWVTLCHCFSVICSILLCEGPDGLFEKKHSEH